MRVDRAIYKKNCERKQKMKRIIVSDMTLPMHSALSFKEKVEIARHLDHLKADVIHMPKISNLKMDSLLIRTISAFVKNSAICVDVGVDEEGVNAAFFAVSGAKHPRLSVSLPVSPVQMEYSFHKKPEKMLDLAKKLFALACAKCPDVEFFAEDATRADKDFLKKVICAAIEAGVKTITVCDDEGAMLPDEFSIFFNDLKNETPELKKVNIGILCRNSIGMATASAVMAIKAGADEMKCAVGVTDIPDIDTFSKIINECGERCGCYSSINYNELHRITRQIEWICGDKATPAPIRGVLPSNESDSVFDIHDDIETISDAICKIGYDLSSEDVARVYDEFKRVAEKKTVTTKDLDAIVASVAMQASPVYKLESYVINNGNVISSSAQICLSKEGELINGIAIGDGPIDAAFRALEQIIGHHYELDDFQIQAVTEGKEAVGSALIKLRNNGKLYSGNGASTDIICAAIRAYINAINKIVCEEAEI